ncbi:MAG TPA: DUF883 C-terminal domain-containing protein [Pseudomonadota bacterium]|nr:DUF883 C-terminal domain-containing protein [Pseudomonadota bacterium]
MTTMNQDKQHNKIDNSNGSKNGHGSDMMSDNQKRKPAVESRTENQVDAAADSASDALKNAADLAKDALGQAEKEAQVIVQEFKERLEPLDQWVRTTTQEHPYLVVGSAIGVSFLAGFLMRRRAAVSAGVAVGFLTGCVISGRSFALAKQAEAASRK